MAKKTSYALKQLIPEENPKTGTKYIVRKPTKGMKVAEKLRLKNTIPFSRSMCGLLRKKCPHIVSKIIFFYKYSNLPLYLWQIK